MKTTIFLDDRLGQTFKEEAKRRGMSLSRFLAESGRHYLARSGAKAKRPFRLITYQGDGPLEGVRLDKTSELLAAEDLERYRGQRGSDSR